MSKKSPGGANDKPPRIAAFAGLPKKITELLEKESDRGVILILATYYEELLGLIINAGCTSPEQADKILAHRQPAGDFDSRILIAHAFGLIHDEEVDALRIVQRIRNKAAHFDRSGRGFDVLFDSTATADQVIAFAKLFYPSAEIPTRQPEFLRFLFIRAGRTLSTRLVTRLGETRPAQACKSAKEKANEVRERIKDSEFYKQFEKAIEKYKDGDHTEIDAMIESFAVMLKTPEHQNENTVALATFVFGEVDALKKMHHISQETPTDLPDTDEAPDAGVAGGGYNRPN
ncbi:hypothetical protein [Hymenobacter metallicola]|uniref:DUF4145 domain-containing protein n=1 Tax=Hymenobacter metallicola TaxID=2563114 RepID=A0A4Z0QA32_9BACT|nr:hypothetical protein [Hymenobacter metallicola]TGE26917.1 hypothetical protein E5K02_10950 [Hymenobacter metallicola]